MFRDSCSSKERLICASESFNLKPSEGASSLALMAAASKGLEQLLDYTKREGDQPSVDVQVKASHTFACGDLSYDAHSCTAAHVHTMHLVDAFIASRCILPVVESKST